MKDDKTITSFAHTHHSIFNLYNAEFAQCFNAMASEASSSHHLPMTMEATAESKIQFEPMCFDLFRNFLV